MRIRGLAIALVALSVAAVPTHASEVPRDPVASALKAQPHPVAVNVIKLDVVISVDSLRSLALPAIDSSPRSAESRHALVDTSSAVPSRAGAGHARLRQRPTFVNHASPLARLRYRSPRD